MKKKLICLALGIGIALVCSHGLLVTERSDTAAYYFDYVPGKITFMIPRCEQSDGKFECASNVVSAWGLASKHFAEFHFNRQTGG